MKCSLTDGFAGLDNPIFVKETTNMLVGNVKDGREAGFPESKAIMGKSQGLASI